MSIFMADCDLPGITLEHLAQAQRRAIEASERSTALGRPIRYLRSVWVPGDWRVMWLFEAEDAAAVEDGMRAAHIPFLRVVDALDLTSAVMTAEKTGGG